MGLRIQQLPALIANQIAAGEVIERPASVVKELLENSLDAGATAISIELNYGGLNQIKISDNGVGIVGEDLPLAITAHATSKINSLNDLYAIESMGFRGEALASIAAIAKITISSRTREQQTATRLESCDGAIQLLPCARAVGTTIDVKDLFFNAPVRKRFLKSESLELQTIVTVVKRFALSAPQIALTLKHQDKQILSLAAATNENARAMRVRRLLGNLFMKEAIFLETDRGSMQLEGWVSSPHYQRSQNDRLWVYLNHRIVKDKLINHAIKQAYENHLHAGRYPVCVLYLNIDPGEVDVNVHPTKHEVRFQQPRLIHDFIYSQIKKALESTIIQENNHARQESVLLPVIQESLGKPYVPVANFPPRNSTTKSPDYKPWVVLNARYILRLQPPQEASLVDLKVLYQQRTQALLFEQSIPLTSRPLLVPVNFCSDFLISDLLKKHLSSLGFEFEWVDANTIRVRRIPILVPYLSLELFWQGLLKLANFELSSLLHLLSESQHVDAYLLSDEEQQELLHWLEKQKVAQDPCFRALSLERCKELFNG